MKKMPDSGSRGDTGGKEKPYVIIPNAVMVAEELRSIGKLTPVLYPVSQEIVFDFLYRQYRDCCEKIRVVCYEQAETVRRRLAGYGPGQVEILELSRLKDLAYTVYSGLPDGEVPVVVHYGDTIVFDNICSGSGDCFFYSEDDVSEKWTYFEMENGVVERVYDKVLTQGEGKKKLFTGVFRFSDSGLLKRCIREAGEEEPGGVSLFYRALMRYSKVRPLDAVKAEEWFDIGHIEKYYDSSLGVRARTFNHITVDKNRGILKKTSEDKEKFLGEILWYLKLPADIEYVRPRIFSYSTGYENPFVEMEYYSYHTLHELYLYGELSASQWRGVFRKIKFICRDFKRYLVRDENIRSALEEMYLGKTLRRLGELEKDRNFESFFENPPEINGVRYRPLKEIMETLKTVVPGMLYDVEEFHIIHGDLCFANILADNNLTFIKVVDPRGSFGQYDIYGDSRYELAKLFHSLDGKYDFIIKDLFEMEYDAERARIKMEFQERTPGLFGIFLSEFQEEIGDDYEKICLIEALLFLSMIPLHRESLAHQYAMLAAGLEILGRAADIKVQGGTRDV